MSPWARSVGGCARSGANTGRQSRSESSARRPPVTRIKRLDHIALVVDDVEAALAFWRDALGIEVERVQEVPEQQATVAFLPVGGSDIELVRPTTGDSRFSPPPCQRRAPRHPPSPPA